MTHPIQAAPADHAPGYKVDISRGQRIGRVSSEWFSRPEDERYLSLNELFDVVRARAEAATARTVETRAIRSEEHTSELQSLMRISYAVFCLKTKNTQQTKTTLKTTIKTHTNRTHYNKI